MAGAVGRRRHDRPAERGEDVARDRMARARARRCVSRPAVASSATGQPAALGSTASAAPARTPSREPLGRRRRSARGAPRAATIGHMGDQRIERRAALGRVEARDRLRRWWRRRRGRRRSRSGKATRPPAASTRAASAAAAAVRRRAVPGRLRLDHSGCRWRSHRGYRACGAGGSAVIRAAFWQAECSAVW